MSEKIKVLYDISILGQAWYQQASRTGIFRVSEEMAHGLAVSDQCQLYYCANASSFHWHLASEYLKQNPRLKAAGHFSQNKLLKEAGRIYGIWTKNETENCLFLMEAILNKFKKHVIDSGILGQAQVFHTGFYYPMPEQIRKARHIKKFLFVHDLIPVLYPDFFVPKATALLMYALAMNEDNWFLCNSHCTKKDLCNYLPDLDPGRVFVLPLGASGIFFPCHDECKFRQIQGKYKIPDGPYIISVCTLEPRKNLAHLIRCFKDLIQQERINDLFLVLVGGKGWYYDEIFKEIDDGIKDRIILTGYVEDGELAALYSRALAFVSPSLYEGFSLPTLEAMQCGVPVITSNTSAFPELVGDAGMMVPPNDKEALCQGILELYKIPSIRETMSQRGIARSKVFTWQRSVEGLMKAYKTALGK